MLELASRKSVARGQCAAAGSGSELIEQNYPLWFVVSDLLWVVRGHLFQCVRMHFGRHGFDSVIDKVGQSLPQIVAVTSK